jgi:hypothetical protein
MSPDFGHLNIAATVDDPKAYTRPWIVRLQQQIVADTENHRREPSRE